VVVGYVVIVGMGVDDSDWEVGDLVNNFEDIADPTSCVYEGGFFTADYECAKSFFVLAGLIYGVCVSGDEVDFKPLI
jgi:hypothetical protein